MNENSETLYTPETPLPIVKSEFDKAKEKRSPQKTNLRKILKGKAWLLYKGAGTLIVDDVHGVELVCKSNRPSNIKGVEIKLLAQSLALQASFDAGLMEIISHQKATAINDTFSKDIGLNKMVSDQKHTDLPSKFTPKAVGFAKPVVNRQPEVEEIEVTDADCHGPTLEESLAKIEELCKTHPNQTPPTNDAAPSMCAHPSTFQVLKGLLEKQQLPQKIDTPTPLITPNEQFRVAGHRAVDSIADMMIAFRKM